LAANPGAQRVLCTVAVHRCSAHWKRQRNAAEYGSTVGPLPRHFYPA